MSNYKYMRKLCKCCGKRKRIDRRSFCWVCTENKILKEQNLLELPRIKPNNLTIRIHEHYDYNSIYINTCIRYLYPKNDKLPSCISNIIFKYYLDLKISDIKEDINHFGHTYENILELREVTQRDKVSDLFFLVYKTYKKHFPNYL